MRKLIVALYGPPGAGKGTQANLLSWKRDYHHFDSGRYIESILRDPANKKNKLIQKYKSDFDNGILISPSWVRKMTAKKSRILGEAGISAVFSGTPRTIFEAFGDEKNEGVIAVLEKHYGRKNMFFFYLDVSAATSIRRNSSRRVCTVCATVISGLVSAHRCPICLGALRTRTLDKPEVIKKRLIEYKERTFPILKGLRARGYKVIKIDAELLPSKVFEQIDRKLPQ